MTTPGRTHIPWQTQTGQVQELISYIGFLEAKVQYLQQHHEHCDTWNRGPVTMELDLPYLPPENTLTSPPESPESSSSIEFMPTTIPPPPVQPSKKALDANPRWKRIIDLMVKDWDDTYSWTKKRNSLGLDTIEKNNCALTIVLGLSKSLSQNPFQHSLAQNPGISPTTSPDDALIYSARQYAIDTKTSRASAGLLVQIHTFRELVFASLCVVMEAQGLPIPTINDLMRICMSSSGAANLYRLRRGALWVNRVIGGLMKRGWGHAATEFFLLSGKPVSQYGLLWESCAHSFPYLTARLSSIRESVSIPVVEPERIPFFIPLIIKELVGDSLSLGQICLALDYEEKVLIELPFS